MSEGKFRRRIYLLRHADVSYFDDQRQPVPPNEVPLNADGLRQAESVADELRAVTIDRVVTSDLPRTRQTAEIVLHSRDDAPPIESTALLREIQPGRLADLSPEEARGAFLESFGDGVLPESRFLGGETFASFTGRVLPFFRTLLGETDWEHLLLVAHGGVNRLIVLEALGVGLKGLAALEQDPCCVNVLDVSDDGKVLVRLLNHTPYNPTKEGARLTTMERLLRQYLGDG